MSTPLPLITFKTDGSTTSKVPYQTTAEIQKKADDNDPQAQYYFALMCRNGHELVNGQVIQTSKKPDFVAARHWHEKAANQGYLNSQYMLAVFKIKGFAGFPKDPKTGWEEVQTIASKGCADASADFGMHNLELAEGAADSKQKDEYSKTAGIYLRQAIAQGVSNSQAFHFVGIGCFSGNFGLKQNKKLGIKYMIKASKMGYTSSLMSLIICVQNGDISAEELKKAGLILEVTAASANANASFTPQFQGHQPSNGNANVSANANAKPTSN